MSTKPWKITVWTEPVRARFFELAAHRDRPSYDYIAKELNKEFGLAITRNAAISFAKRNHVVRRLVKIGRPRSAPGSHRQRLPGSVSKRKPVVKSQPIGRVTIAELLPHDCRWPFGDRAPFTFCGAPKLEASSYCNEHTRLAWAKMNRV